MEGSRARSCNLDPDLVGIAHHAVQGISGARRHRIAHRSGCQRKCSYVFLRSVPHLPLQPYREEFPVTQSGDLVSRPLLPTRSLDGVDGMSSPRSADELEDLNPDSGAAVDSFMQGSPHDGRPLPARQAKSRTSRQIRSRFPFMSVGLLEWTACRRCYPTLP